MRRESMTSPSPTNFINLILSYRLPMHNSLRMRPKLSLNIERTRGSNRSSPSSPRKCHLHKKVSLLTNGEESNTLWNQSSMSLTRDQSPVHKIPNSVRFRSIEEETLMNRQFLTLELRRDVKTDKAGKRFPKSKRPEHFVKGLGHQGPSPASYNYAGFTEENNSSTLSNYYNPESAELASTKQKHQIKGRSFSMFSNHHKSYIDHSKHKVYQPENVIGQPGPGHYNHSFVAKPKKSSYTMRSILKRFNESPSLSPGPGAYGQIFNERTTSPNVKGTFDLSQRTYLTKFQKNPSPSHYEVSRFLETTM